MVAAPRKTYLAVDLGASSGRVLAGKYDGEKLHLEEVHRFGNGGVKVGPHLYWDLLRLWTDIKEGLRKAHQAFGESICSVGVDTWGVDFGSGPQRRVAWQSDSLSRRSESWNVGRRL